jgi:hypothetical protein
MAYPDCPAAEYAHCAINLIICAIESANDILEVKPPPILRHALANWSQYLHHVPTSLPQGPLHKLFHMFCLKFIVGWADLLAIAREGQALIPSLEEASRWAVGAVVSTHKTYIHDLYL